MLAKQLFVKYRGHLGLYAICFLLLFRTIGLSQTNIDTRLTVGFNAIQATNLRADVTFLASEALEGRMSLERGSDVAIQFIAAEYVKAGLKPLSGSSYFQEVPLIEYKPDTKETELILTRQGNQQRYQYITDFYGRFPREVTINGPVAFAGYGITAPELGYDDYKDIDVRGKIVLIFDHEPQENYPKSVFNGLGNTRYANSLLKIINAQNHGAVGVLLVSEPNRKHPSNQERIARIPGILERMNRFPSQDLAESEWKIPDYTISDAVAAKLLATSGKKPSELQAAIDALLKPASMNLPDTQIEMRVVNAMHRRSKSANVLGMIEGSDPALKDETIVFSAHHDHDGIYDGKIYPGADDNASGTAGVIELARAFAKNPVKPRRTLLFVVFAAEERGLLGSYYYTSHPLRPLETTRAVINFDMIGRNETASAQTEGLIEIAQDTSNELNLIGTINSPDYRLAVEQENTNVGLRLNYKWDNDSALNVYQRSDQFPFAVHNIPAVWWFTGFHPDYHQPSDTAEKINFIKMERIVRLAYLSGWAFADKDRVLHYNAKPPNSNANRKE